MQTTKENKMCDFIKRKYKRINWAQSKNNSNSWGENRSRQEMETQGAETKLQEENKKILTS